LSVVVFFLMFHLFHITIIFAFFMYNKCFTMLTVYLVRFMLPGYGDILKGQTDS